MDRKQLCAAVTGGAKGIGEAIVRRLMQDGYGHIALLDVDADAAAEAAKRIDPTGETVLPFACDVSDAQDREALFADMQEKFGRLDVLVNNAGVAPVQRLDVLETTAESFERLHGELLLHVPGRRKAHARGKGPGHSRLPAADHQHLLGLGLRLLALARGVLRVQGGDLHGDKVVRGQTGPGGNSGV